MRCLRTRARPRTTASLLWIVLELNDFDLAAAVDIFALIELVEVVAAVCMGAQEVAAL